VCAQYRLLSFTATKVRSRVYNSPSPVLRKSQCVPSSLVSLCIWSTGSHPTTYSRFILTLPLGQRQNILPTPSSLAQSQREHNTIDPLKDIWRRVEIMQRLP